MAKRRKKTSKKSRKSKARKKSNHIPLPILVHRLKRLTAVVRSRSGGRAA